MNLRTEEVFTPNGYPEHTYVTRNNSEFENNLSLALKMVGFVSVAGPSKSGKTVLVEKVIGPGKLISVAGGNVASSDGLWALVISKLGEHQSITRSSATTGAEKYNLGLKAGIGVEASSGMAFENSQASTEAKTYLLSGPEYACNILRERELTLLVDDFHYIPKNVQQELAKQFKEITRAAAKQKRIQIIVASVPHRADDPVRANPDLNGRIGTVDLEYWKPEELQEIAEKGFLALNIKLPPILMQKMSVQAAGSPQLMQTLCYTLAAMALKIEETQVVPKTFTPRDSDVESVLKLVAKMNDSRTLVGKLDEGKKTRGVDRVIYNFVDNSEGDVYTCILRALALDPPALDFEALELEARIQRLCRFKPPPWHSVVKTLGRMQEIADSMQSTAFVWDNEQLQLTDPHVLFYLRWCGDYREPRMRVLESPPIRRPHK